MLGRLRVYHSQGSSQGSLQWYTEWLTSGVQFSLCLKDSMKRLIPCVRHSCWRIAQHQRQEPKLVGLPFVNQRRNEVLVWEVWRIFKGFSTSKGSGTISQARANYRLLGCIQMCLLGSVYGPTVRNMLMLKDSSGDFLRCSIGDGK